MPTAWKRRVSVAALFVALFALPQPGPAQPPARNSLPSPAATPLDHPIELGGMWRMLPGDNPAYAQPDFDDTHWQLVDIRKNAHTYVPNAEPEVLWYRQRIPVAPTQANLALEAYRLAPAYEVYVNGRQVLHAGSVKPYVAYTTMARSLAPIPKEATASGWLVIAVRVHCSHAQWAATGSPGLSRGNLALGPQDALQDHIWIRLIGGLSQRFLVYLIGFGVGLLALALYVAQRNRTEYLWLFCYAGLFFLYTVLDVSNMASDRRIGWHLATSMIAPLITLSGIAVYFAFLHFRAWIWLRIGLAIVVLAEWAVLLADPYYKSPSWILSTGYFLFSLVRYGLLPILLIIQFRRGNREAGILLIPNLLMGVYIYPYFFITMLASVPAWTKTFSTLNTAVENFGLASIGPFNLFLANAFTALGWCAWAFILVWRSNRISSEQTRLTGELEAARQVQQVILPELCEDIPGFGVECVYKPAQQVGGDFFQVMPMDDGALLLVLGDVAGKGLPAAMMVSVLVGAIRTAACYTHDPGRILAELNTRLMGRSNGGFSTCLAAYIDAQGQMALANAGHLSPYLDGRELEMPGALPLGILPGQQYENSIVTIAPDSRIVFYSDGVIEAQNRKGELFGFEHSREISIRPAEEIAQAAAAFGQNDDITVVAIRYEPASLRLAAAQPSAPAIAMLN